MNPLVSILIPAYNSEKWITATIKSALAQTWSNKEIIIVNDGSKDNTYKVAKEFESESVRVFSQKNSGASAARNKALSESKGDFIQWLDADDILAMDKIEVQLSMGDSNPQSKILLSSAWGFFYSRIKKAKFVPNPLWKDLPPLNWLVNHIGEGHYMYPAAWLVSRKLTELAGPWNERLSYNDDGEYFCRVVASSELVKFIPESLSYHRGGNLSSLSRSAGSEKAVESLEQSITLCIDHLLKLENSELTREASVKHLKKMLSMIYKENSNIIIKAQKKITELGGSVTSVTKTSKFIIIQKIFGERIALFIKSKLWEIQILIEKYWEKFIGVFVGDNT